jgi:hypothetical protein
LKETIKQWNLKAKANKVAAKLGLPLPFPEITNAAAQTGGELPGVP